MSAESPSINSSVLLRRIIEWVAVIGILVVGGTAIAMLVMTFQYESFWRPLIRDQLPAMVGLPLAALASLALVTVLEKTSGRIEFEGPGFKLRGASGPVLLWVLCFLAMTLSIKLTWNT